MVKEIGADGLHTLLEKSETPIAAFAAKPSKKSSRYDRLVLVTDMAIKDKLGVAIVEVETSASVEGEKISANKTITAYDMKSAIREVQEALESGRLLYIDKKRGYIFDSGKKGANCPTTMSRCTRTENIQHFWETVKREKAKKSKTFSRNADKRRAERRREEADSSEDWQKANPFD